MPNTPFQIIQQSKKTLLVLKLKYLFWKRSKSFLPSAWKYDPFHMQTMKKRKKKTSLDVENLSANWGKNYLTLSNERDFLV